MTGQIGIIGLGNQAARIRHEVELCEHAEVACAYHPTRYEEGSTKDFDEILACDAVFIASPNDTHIDYLLRLGRDFEGYVFCEKPPVNRTEDIERLKKRGPDPSRLFFNFTYRYSSFMQALESAVELGHLGDLVSFTAVIGHGLAFKPGYGNSWRADADRNRFGVLETIGVHFIDLLLSVWGPFETIGHDSANIVGTGTSYDISRLHCVFPGGATASIVTTIATPFIWDVLVVGTSGILTLRDGFLTLKNPRDTYDDRGFFKAPPIIAIQPVDAERMYEQALSLSVNTFLGYARDIVEIPRLLYDTSIKTNEVLLSIKE